jgi:hypothetical protein
VSADPDAAADESVRELERRLRMVVPPSLLADPHAFAVAFKNWELAHGWYRRDTPPAVTLAQPDPEATARGVAKAREALRKERPMTCPPCAAAADEDQALARPIDMPGHDASICRDPATCPCAHQPVGTSTPTEENHG